MPCASDVRRGVSGLIVQTQRLAVAQVQDGGHNQGGLVFRWYRPLPILSPTRWREALGGGVGRCLEDVIPRVVLSDGSVAGRILDWALRLS